MKIDILGGSYEQKYLNYNSQRTINWYPVITTQEEQSKTQIALFPTPGLSTFATSTGRYGRGIFTARTTLYNRCFTVIDKTLYEVNPAGTLTSRGTLTNVPTGSSKVWMEVNGNQELMIGNYTASYYLNLSTNTLTELTDADYPENITSLAYMDGYMVVASGGRVYFSDANSVSAWTGSSVFTPTLRADPTIAVGAQKGILYCFGSETIEPYYLDGTASVFSRYGATNTLQTGILSEATLAKFDQGFIFVSKSQSGELGVALLVDNQVNPIDDSAIRWKLNSVASDMNTASGHVIQTKDGRTVYRLSVPDLATTFCYDISSNMWTEQQSTVPADDSDGSINYDVYRGKYLTNFNGLNLYTDVYTGNILKEDYSIFTEVGETIRRLRRSQTFTDEDFKDISVVSFELDGAKGTALSSGQGSDPIMVLDVSYDGGHTYTSSYNIPLGSIGDYRVRQRVFNLGTGRDLVFQLTLTDPIDFMMQAAYAKGIIAEY
jgi:hypothetical protein